MRNYKRYLGTLLETHWTLEEIEVGVTDKVYDPINGKHFFEKKIIKSKISGIIDVQWLKERVPEEQWLAEMVEESELKDEAKDELPIEP